MACGGAGDREFTDDPSGLTGDADSGAGGDDGGGSRDDGGPDDQEPPADMGPLGSCLAGTYSGTASLMSPVVNTVTATPTISITLEEQPSGEFYTIVGGTLVADGTNSLGQDFHFTATVEGNLDCAKLQLVGGAITEGSSEICMGFCASCYFDGTLSAAYDWIEHRFVDGVIETTHTGGDFGADCNSEGTWEASLE